MEWISIKDKLPEGLSGTFEIKTANGKKLQAIYYWDKVDWIAVYGITPTHWWEDCSTNKPIYDATHWRKRDGMD